MNWNYITGFFDADGCVMYSRPGKTKKRCAVVSFSNVERSILNKIQEFIKNELGYNGSIATKYPRTENESTSYDLKYIHRSAVEVLKRMDTQHPKKRHRKNVLLRIQKQKPRNGKYKPIQLENIVKLESQWK